MTPEESALAARKGRAEAVIWICASVIGIAVLIVAFAFLSLPDIPEAVFGEMAILFQVIIWGPLLLIPLIGIVIAACSRWTAASRLRRLREEAASE